LRHPTAHKETDGPEKDHSPRNAVLDISVLLTDIGLPGMSGQQLINEALNLRPDLKIIVASGYSSGRETLDPRTVANQLPKPFDIKQLRRALET